MTSTITGTPSTHAIRYRPTILSFMRFSANIYIARASIGGIGRWRVPGASPLLRARARRPGPTRRDHSRRAHTIPTRQTASGTRPALGIDGFLADWARGDLFETPRCAVASGGVELAGRRVGDGSHRSARADLASTRSGGWRRLDIHVASCVQNSSRE
jgi:hypothetical protein